MAVFLMWLACTETETETERERERERERAFLVLVKSVRRKSENRSVVKKYTYKKLRVVLKLYWAVK